MKIKLNIDRTVYKTKDAAKQHIGAIKNKVGAGSTEIEANELIALVESGGSFAPALLNGTEAKNWQSQQVIIADIDNDEKERDEKGDLIKDENGKNRKVPVKFQLASAYAAEICKAHGITPFFMYHTLSNGKVVDGVSIEKYRIIIVLDTPITEATEANELTARFADIFNKAAPGAADVSIKNLDRVVFGSNKGSAFNITEAITPLEVVRELPEIQKAPTAPDPRQEPAKYDIPHTDRRYDDIKEQRRYDIENFDLESYILSKEPGTRVNCVGNQRYINPCPLCGHTDDFRISGHIFKPFCMDEGDGGTIIDYLMYRENKTLQEALKKFDSMMNYAEPAPKIRPQNDFLEEKAESINADELTAENGNLPGLLTYEAAVNTFATANDKYIEMAKFPEFCKRAKIKTHDSVVIAADTGAGKSSLALNFIDNLNDNYPVIYFNLEMDELTALRRLVSIRTGVELDRIEGYQHDENTAELVNSALKIITSRQPLQIIQDKYSISDIEAEIKRATKGREEPTIVVIDHSLLVTTEDNFTRYERFTQISEQLRKISRLNNVIMFILLQQNRSGKEDETKRPTNSSLK